MTRISHWNVPNFAAAAVVAMVLSTYISVVIALPIAILLIVIERGRLVMPAAVIAVAVKLLFFIFGVMILSPIQAALVFALVAFIIISFISKKEK